MSILSDLTHHATLFVHSDRKSFAEGLWKELRKESLAHVFHDITVVDIETARALASWVNIPYEGEKIALISFHIITLPAQNALLKILEEPRMGVKFILVTTNKESIIPTLYSRLEEHVIDNDIKKKNSEAELFLRTPHEQRMKLSCIITVLNRVDEEGRKDREGVRTFILSLADTLSSEKEHSKYVINTLEMASYVGDSSSSGKAILEYLALLLPQIKV